MFHSKLLSYWTEHSRQARLRQQKDFPLQVESLEPRNLLAVVPVLITINDNGADSSPQPIVDVNGTAFFFARDVFVTGYELWKSDGSTAGTQLVKDINPGAADSTNTFDFKPPMVNVSGTLYFRANDGSSGYELWKSDGTEAGTQLVKDLYFGPNSSDPQELVNVSGTLFFQANDGSNGMELWMSDGTSGGTQLVKDINSVGFAGSNPDFLTNVDGTLFFSANDGTSGRELWKSDGTNGGTQLVKNTSPGAGDSSPDYLTNFDGTLFFAADDGSAGRELWKSDGTSGGTELVKDINPGSDDSIPQWLTNVNGTVFFSANHESYGRELWKSDGTSSGTVLIKDVNPGTGYGINRTFNGGFYYNLLVNLNGTLFFEGDEGVYGEELWISDGTSEGTERISDIQAGIGNADITNLTNINGTLFFLADDSPNTAREPWISDGTVEGTVLLKDITVGDDGSNPYYFTNVNGTAFFSASDSDTHGRELWVVFPPPTLEITPNGGATSNESILFTFEFSQEVTGFEVGDIMITNGTASTFTPVDGNTYTLEVIPTAEGIVTVEVGDMAAQDAAGSDNEPATASIEYAMPIPTPVLVTGSEAGSGIVRVFDQNGVELYSFFPYTESYNNGVRVATGDINGDGILDIVTATGPGSTPHVQAFDSQTGELITGGVNSFYAYNPFYSGGVYIAVGDVNDDGYDDIITGAGYYGGPHVRVFNGLTGEIFTEFYAYDQFSPGGVTVAAGDVNGDGRDEVITGAISASPYVRVFDGMNSTGVPIVGPTTNFIAYPGFDGPVYVASGDVDNDGFDDIITGAGAGGGPHVRVFDSVEANLIQDFYAYDPSFLGGVRVASADLNGDDFFDILTVPGPGGGPHTRAFNGIDATDLVNIYSGPASNLDGLFIAGGVSLIPVDAMSRSAPLSSFYVSDDADPPEDFAPDALTPKKSWVDDTEEFYQSAEEIDKLFSGLGID
ncbi:Hypothetical protein PBC10988_28420 [Planctomycetales bacterium 10988]|nr:Hypothetical protein PBC10988_28420 [Planctomycetales bacterium 10988]